MPSKGLVLTPPNGFDGAGVGRGVTLGVGEFVAWLFATRFAPDPNKNPP